eukprot:6849-Rhodomonas_salina.11
MAGTARGVARGANRRYGLRAGYAMSGTDIVYVGIGLRACYYAMSGADIVSSGIGLCVRDAMSGTDLACRGIGLCVRDAVSGTDAACMVLCQMQYWRCFALRDAVY